MMLITIPFLFFEFNIIIIFEKNLTIENNVRY